MTGAREDDAMTLSWLTMHIGRVVGVAGGLVTLGALAFLAAVGFRPALYVLCFAGAGVLLIYLGGRIHKL